MFDKGLDTPLFIYISQKSRKSMKFVSLSFFTQSTGKILLTGIEWKERKNDKKSSQHWKKTYQEIVKEKKFGSKYLQNLLTYFIPLISFYILWKISENQTFCDMNWVNTQQIWFNCRYSPIFGIIWLNML